MKAGSVAQPDSVVLVGGGGHARVVLDAIRCAGILRVVGVLDRDPARHGTSFDGVPILGGDDLLASITKDGVGALVTVGSIDVPTARARVFQKLVELGIRAPVVVHPHATVASGSKLGEGSVVLAHAVVNPGADLRENVIVNTAAVVEHDVSVGAHSHISPGALIGGGVRIGSMCHIGLGARILQGVRVGDNVLVGAGAVVIADLPRGARVVGVPARSIDARRTTPGAQV